MKAALFPRSAVDVLLVFFVLWFGSSAGGYLLTIGVGKPLYAYIALVVVALFYALAEAAAKGSLEVLQDRWRRRLLLWLLGYLAYGAITFIGSSQSAVAVQALITLCELTLMAAALALFLSHRRRVDQAAAAFALLALIATGLNLFDFIAPTFSNVPGRSAGLYLNPNTSGAAIAMAMLCGVQAVPRRLRWPFVLACGVGVFVTFSRGAWVLWGLAVAWLGSYSGFGNPKRRLIIAVMGALLGIWFVLAVFSGELGRLVVGTSLVHYLDPNTLARLGVGASSVSGFAAEQRLDAALYALHVFPGAPLLGHGIGYVYEWGFPAGPHNMYLRFLADGGLVGLLLYLALMWLLWRGAKGLDRVLALQVIVAGFFSHNMLEQPAIVLIMVFLLARSAVLRRELHGGRVAGVRMVPA